jgi:hypothetical protein
MTMRTTALLGLAVGFAGLAGAAVAQQAGPSPAAGSSDNDPNRIICHTRPAPTGTRLGSSSECHTQKQWEDMRQQNQEQLSNVQLKGLNTTPPGH